MTKEFFTWLTRVGTNKLKCQFYYLQNHQDTLTISRCWWLIYQPPSFQISTSYKNISSEFELDTYNSLMMSIRAAHKNLSVLVISQVAQIY